MLQETADLSRGHATRGLDGCPVVSGGGGDVFKPTVARLDPPGPHHDDLNDQQYDHQADHTGELVARHEGTNDEGGDDRGAPAKRVADAVGPQPYLGREQFWRIN